jgi:hypothetical protein
MMGKPVVAVVVRAMDGHLFESAIHSFDCPAARRFRGVGRSDAATIV